MKKKWAPKSAAQRKAHLLEEIGEVLVELGKCDRFGIDTRFDPNIDAKTTDPRYKSNREALIRELMDLQHAITMYIDDLTSIYSNHESQHD